LPVSINRLEKTKKMQKSAASVLREPIAPQPPIVPLRPCSASPPARGRGRGHAPPCPRTRRGYWIRAPCGGGGARQPHPRRRSPAATSALRLGRAPTGATGSGLPTAVEELGCCPNRGHGPPWPHACQCRRIQAPSASASGAERIPLPRAARGSAEWISSHTRPPGAARAARDGHGRERGG
jgi:hypothetical protein